MDLAQGRALPLSCWKPLCSSALHVGEWELREGFR